MSYVESFKRAMERARASVSYWDHKTLDHLQAAHDAEMRQCSKSEYHRGFEDGKATRDADQWQLEIQRKSVVARLQAVKPSELCGSHESLSAICKAVRQPVMGWTVGACELLRNRLIALMGGTLDAQNASFFAGNQQNGPKSGEKQPEMQRDESKSRDSLQEVQSPSITDELREYLDKNGQEYESFGGAEVATIRGGTTPLYAIADRIDAMFAHICSQQEAVLQQTISETVDEHEQEMAELRHDVEMWRDRAEDMREERDELQDRLQAISVLCEQDDG